MASTLASQRTEVAKALPVKLLKFFRKHPPPALLQTPPPEAVVTSHTYTSTISEGTPVVNTASKDPDENTAGYKNPFLPWRHPATGRWHGPRYSLRQQASLFKMAASEGIDSLLPFSLKAPEYKRQRKAEMGLRVKGTGVGDRVKGHVWERQLKPKLDKRRDAMQNMPQMIKQWKERGHGRGWKKWPK